MARNIVLSKHPFSEDDVEIIKQARADREQDKAFYYVASLVNRKTFIEQDSAAYGGAVLASMAFGSTNASC